MGRKFQEGPEKNCDYCGKPLERKRYKNSLEDMGRFKERRYCDKFCFGKAIVKEEVTLAGYRARAKKFRRDVCESCGSKENLDTHHRDGNVENNDPQNIATLCETCHMQGHWKNRKNPERSKCRICGLPAKGKGLCSKHYFREKRHGDPEYKKGSHGQT